MRSILRTLTMVRASTKKLAVVALVLSAVAVPVALPAAAALAAPSTTSVCEGVALTGGGCDPGTNQFTNVIRFVIRILSFIAGVAAVIMIVIGGLRYITSGGDSSKIASAKQAIIYALVGLVVVALSQFIVRFVLTNAAK